MTSFPLELKTWHLIKLQKLWDDIRFWSWKVHKLDKFCESLLVIRGTRVIVLPVPMKQVGTVIQVPAGVNHRLESRVELLLGHAHVFLCQKKLCTTATTENLPQTEW